ncbi:beta-1,3-galactosyltransferase 1-like isoform X2 [Chelonus insularis]|uniref:beta-1,3-galactosyltransferase 1-like isoform X2 n=1 Tax=Chelonus insularis TaxID=460826 RepID=UPI00158E3C9E|nr:beta-1,3-galactosyltransferase 1-like isoform X2 [Chelonus insularis]
MERVRLVPMELPYLGNNVNLNSNNKRRTSFIRRLGLGCIVLAILGLFYFPAFHSTQDPLFGIVQLSGWSVNTSRDLNIYISPDENTSILSPDEVCTSPPYLLIVVCSAVANQKARMAIRNTWANEPSSNYQSMNITIKVVFLLGESNNDTLNTMILDENYEYEDIIQEKFLDTYNNLTLKSVMMLKWVTKVCPKTTYVMKTDDDMYINIPTLVKELMSRSKSEGTLIGSLICNAPPITNPKNKWYSPKYMFYEKTYPNYLSGTGYVMSSDVAFKLYEAALQIPLLHLEDVFITGLCARKAKLRPANHPGFSYIPRKLDSCVLKNTITAHKVNSSTMYAIWDKLSNSNTPCASTSNDNLFKILKRYRKHISFTFSKKRNNNKCI